MRYIARRKRQPSCQSNACCIAKIERLPTRNWQMPDLAITVRVKLFLELEVAGSVK
jgi:hypothetical protein